MVVASALVLLGTTAPPAVAHGGETSSAEQLVLIAIAVLEVHPAPAAAVDEKIRDAQEAKDPSGVNIALLARARAALKRGDVTTTKRVLEQSVGVCPDNDILNVGDQSAKPPCVAPAHALALARRSVGGTSEVVLLIVAGLLALAGLAIIRRPHLRLRRSEGVR